MEPDPNDIVEEVLAARKRLLGMAVERRVLRDRLDMLNAQAADDEDRLARDDAGWLLDSVRRARAAENGGRPADGRTDPREIIARIKAKAAQQAPPPRAPTWVEEVAGLCAVPAEGGGLNLNPVRQAVVAVRTCDDPVFYTAGCTAPTDDWHMMAIRLLRDALLMALADRREAMRGEPWVTERDEEAETLAVALHDEAANRAAGRG